MKKQTVQTKAGQRICEDISQEGREIQVGKKPMKIRSTSNNKGNINENKEKTPFDYLRQAKQDV